MTSTNITRLPETNSGTVTSWLPITTTWPTITQCSTEIYSQTATVPGENVLAMGFDPYFNTIISPNVFCLPPEATSWWQQPQQTPQLTVTSIGPIICPGLYSTATTSVLNSESTWVACCPTSYDFIASIAPGSINITNGECNSRLPGGDVFTYYKYDNTESVFELATTTIGAAGSVFAIPVNGWIFAEATSGVPDVSSSSSTAPTSQIQSPTMSAVAQSGGLSTGAKAGIGIGVSIGVLGIAALFGAFYLIRRSKMRALASRPNIEYEAAPSMASPLPVKEPMPVPVQRYEIGSPQQGMPQELANERRDGLYEMNA